MTRRTLRSGITRTLGAGWIVAAIGAAALSSTALAPSVALAQDDEYRATVEEALAEFEAGNFADSLALFRRAHAMRPSARTLRGMGKACFELRRYVDAVNYFGEALASTVNPLTDEQRTEVTSLLSRAEARVGRYAITTDPEDATVAVDGNEASHTLVLDIGPHTITASAAGHATATRSITVAGGEDEHLTMRLEPSTAIVETVVEERIVERVRTDPGEPFRIAGWVMGGVGVAALGLGIGAAVQVEVSHNDYNAATYHVNLGPPDTVPTNTNGACPSLPVVPGTMTADWNGVIPDEFALLDGGTRRTANGCYQAQSTWRTLDPLRYVGFIAGGVLVAAGVVFLVIGHVMEPHEAVTEPAPSSTARDVARGVAFVPAPSGPTLSVGCGPFAELGIACTGRF